MSNPFSHALFAAFGDAARERAPRTERTIHEQTPIQQFFKDHGISEVEAIMPDMAGIARGKIMPAEKFAEDEGMRLPESIFLQTVTGEYPDDDQRDQPVRDRHRAQGRPEDGARRALGGRADRAGDPRLLLRATAGRVTMAPRYVLRHVLELYAQQGWEPVVAPELEFYLVEPNIDPDYPLKPPVGRSGRAETGRQAYSIAAVNEFDPLFDDIYAFCEAQDIEIDTLIHEDGAGADGDQPAATATRSTRRPGVPVQAHGARGGAAPQDVRDLHGQAAWRASRAAPCTSTRASSTRRRGKNIFSDADGTPTPLFFSHIAGLQKYLPAAMALFAPNVNSYRRITRFTARRRSTCSGATTTARRACACRCPTPESAPRREPRSPAPMPIRTSRSPRRSPAAISA